jgi:pyruvyltransferase
MIITFKQKLGHYLKTLCSTKKINAIWWGSKNWGDALNPILIEHLSGLKPFLVREYSENLKNEPIYSVIGSILDWPIFKEERILRNTIIWGTGFMIESGRLPGKPRQICAVRGPLTRDNILKSGIQCPDTYGDPALLYPRMYRPTLNKDCKLGIIPHHMEKDTDYFRNFRNYPEIKIIDIEAPINTVVDQICSCKYIASSSLHGIIIADAYGVPSVYLKISDRVVGDGFKFRDYFGSVGRSETEPLVVSENTTIDDILERVSHYKIDIDLNELLEACPFYHGDTF